MQTHRQIQAKTVQPTPQILPNRHYQIAQLEIQVKTTLILKITTLQQQIKQRITMVYKITTIFHKILLLKTLQIQRPVHKMARKAKTILLQ